MRRLHATLPQERRLPSRENLLLFPQDQTVKSPDGQSGTGPIGIPAARATSNGHVPTLRRFRGDHHYPICGGADDDRRGRGGRCFGFLSGDGAFAHCTRDECAGGIPLTPTSLTYPHRLKGPCRCGKEHGPADPKPSQAKARRGARRPAAGSWPPMTIATPTAPCSSRSCATTPRALSNADPAARGDGSGASTASSPSSSASASVFGQRGASPLQARALRPVTDGNCVLARGGGKQPEVNDQPVTKVNSIRPDRAASLLGNGEARTGMTRKPATLRGSVSKRSRGRLGGWRRDGRTAEHMKQRDLPGSQRCSLSLIRIRRAAGQESERP